VTQDQYSAARNKPSVFSPNALAPMVAAVLRIDTARFQAAQDGIPGTEISAFFTIS
jgi:hypothetical protein